MFVLFLLFFMLHLVQSPNAFLGVRVVSPIHAWPRSEKNKLCRFVKERNNTMDNGEWENLLSFLIGLFGLFLFIFVFTTVNST